MIKNLFDKSSDDQYVELDNVDEKKNEKIVIQVEKLEGFADSDRILNKLRDGGIILVKIKHLREKDDTEFRRAMEKIKKICLNLNGDIGALGNDWLLLTPSFAKIHRSV